MCWLCNWPKYVTGEWGGKQICRGGAWPPPCDAPGTSQEAGEDLVQRLQNDK